MEDSLSEDTYNAELAGLRYSIKNDSTGLVISVGGYNDKLPLLLDTVLDKLRSIQFQPDRLKVISEQVCCCPASHGSAINARCVTAGADIQELLPGSTVESDTGFHVVCSLRKSVDLGGQIRRAAL